jgi:hypothetical protein
MLNALFSIQVLAVETPYFSRQILLRKSVSMGITEQEVYNNGGVPVVSVQKTTHRW